MRRCPPQAHERVRLLLEYAPELAQREVPDPYYDQMSGFDKVADMIDLAVESLVDDLRGRMGAR